MTVGRLVKVVLVVVWVVVRDVPVNVPRTVRCRSVVVICALCAVLDCNGAVVAATPKAGKSAAGHRYKC